MSRPLLLDLFCGAGGAAMGYHRAGFNVVGVDIKPQPHYPFEFYQYDALDLGNPAWWVWKQAQVVHASPPCQAYSDLQKQSKREYPDLIGDIRDRLMAWGGTYIIENVEGSPLLSPVRVCGIALGLRVIRHRLFESTSWLVGTPEPRRHPLVYTRDKRKAHYGQGDEWTWPVQVNGGGNCSVAAARDAMGIDWMTKAELNEAIPPAYTEFIGVQLIEHLARVA